MRTNHCNLIGLSIFALIVLAGCLLSGDNSRQAHKSVHERLEVPCVEDTWECDRSAQTEEAIQIGQDILDRVDEVTPGFDPNAPRGPQMEAIAEVIADHPGAETVAIAGDTIWFRPTQGAWWPIKVGEAFEEGSLERFGDMPSKQQMLMRLKHTPIETPNATADVRTTPQGLFGKKAPRAQEEQKRAKLMEFHGWEVNSPTLEHMADALTSYRDYRAPGAVTSFEKNTPWPDINTGLGPTIEALSDWSQMAYVYVSSHGNNRAREPFRTIHHRGTPEDVTPIGPGFSISTGVFIGGRHSTLGTKVGADCNDFYKLPARQQRGFICQKIHGTHAKVADEDGHTTKIKTMKYESIYALWVDHQWLFEHNSDIYDGPTVLYITGCSTLRGVEDQPTDRKRIPQFFYSEHSAFLGWTNPILWTSSIQMDTHLTRELIQRNMGSKYALAGIDSSLKISKVKGAERAFFGQYGPEDGVFVREAITLLDANSGEELRAFDTVNIYDNPQGRPRRIKVKARIEGVFPDTIDSVELGGGRFSKYSRAYRQQGLGDMGRGNQPERDGARQGISPG